MSLKPDKKQESLPPDHPLVMIRKMIAESAGRLPAPLVVIILLALVMSVLAGFLLMGLQSENRGNGRYEFLPVRVAADQNAPAVTFPTCRFPLKTSTSMCVSIRMRDK
jgi:hypothetical protein